MAQFCLHFEDNKKSNGLTNNMDGTLTCPQRAHLEQVHSWHVSQ